MFGQEDLEQFNRMFGCQSGPVECQTRWDQVGQGPKQVATSYTQPHRNRRKYSLFKITYFTCLTLLSSLNSLLRSLLLCVDLCVVMCCYTIESPFVAIILEKHHIHFPLYFLIKCKKHVLLSQIALKNKLVAFQIRFTLCSVSIPSNTSLII